MPTEARRSFRVKRWRHPGAEDLPGSYPEDRALSRRAEGYGTDPSIAKFIIDAHQGTITVESKPARGSTFTVTIPTVSSA